MFEFHWTELARELIFRLKPSSVLDVGCGEAMLWRGYGYAGKHNVKDPRVKEEWYTFNARVVLFDIDLYKHPMTFVNGNAEHLPFKNKAFDLVISTEVIEHVEDVELFAKEIERVGKSWYITTPSEEELTDRSTARKLFRSNPWLVNLADEYSDDAYNHRAHVRVLTEDQLYKLFPNSHVIKIKASDDGIHYAVVENTVFSLLR